MLKNPNYLYGKGTTYLPHHLNFAKFLLEKLWSNNDKVALINAHTHEKLRCRDIAKYAMNFAISLVKMNVKKGDVVAICSENRQEYFSTVIGIACTGAVVTSINPSLTEGEIEHIIGITKPKVIICSPKTHKIHAELLKTLPYIQNIIVYGEERLNETLLYDDLAKTVNGKDEITIEKFEVVDVIGQIDTAFVLYSSGTTGLPEGIMLTHLAVLTVCFWPPILDPKNMELFVSPCHHVLGLMVTLRTFTFGSTLVYLSKFDVDFCLKTIETYKIKQMIIPPVVLVLIAKCQTKYDVSTLQYLYCTSAPLREEMIKAVKERFPNLTNVWQCYGMTETTFGVSVDTYLDGNAKVGGTGRCLPGVILKVLDVETKNALGPNKSGEIYVKSPTVMKGYVNKDSSEEFDDEGFLKTGDIGYHDEDGYLYVTDRIKEIIKYKGYQVAPAEIEAVLLRLPGVKDAGVVGVPHEIGGEAPRAFVVRDMNCHLTESEIIAFVAEKLSSPKHLRGGVGFVNRIPRNTTGKILRRALKEMADGKTILNVDCAYIRR